MKAAARTHSDFVPTPVASHYTPPRAAAGSGAACTYATPAEFGRLTGLEHETVHRLVAAGQLTHLRLDPTGVHINVKKGLRDLENLEHGPTQ